MKILVLGYHDSGKTTLANILAEQFGLQHINPSVVAAEHIIMKLPEMAKKYASVMECYDDRYAEGNPQKWVDAIAKFNTPDGAALAKLVLQKSDIYTGIRKRVEFDACVQAGLFDVIVWVDAGARIPVDPHVQLTKKDAHVVFDNTTELEFDRLIRNVKRLYAAINQYLAKPTEEQRALNAELNKPLFNKKAVKKESDND